MSTRARIVPVTPRNAGGLAALAQLRDEGALALLREMSGEG